MPIRQSICCPCLRPQGMSYDKFFEIVRQIGYVAVETWMRGDDFDDLLRAARGHGLAVSSMIGHGSLGDGLNNRASHAKIESELRESIDIAAANGIAGVICFSGNRRPGLTDQEGIEVTAEGLRRVAPYAEEKKICLNLELLNSKVDHSGYQCDRTAWGVAVCERVNSRNVQLLYDIYHMQIMEGDLIRTIRENVRFIGHFHTAGVPGRHEPDEAQEINYPAVARAISESGYTGYVGHEFMPTGDMQAALLKTFWIFDQ